MTDFKGSVSGESSPAISLLGAGEMASSRASSPAGGPSLNCLPTTLPASETRDPTNPLKRKASDQTHQIVTFNVKDGKLKYGEEAVFNFSLEKLTEKAPKFYELFKGTGRRVRKIDGAVYDVTQKPKLFEAILYWIDHGKVMQRPYLAPQYLEAYYLDLYCLAEETYELPGLSNAVIDVLYDRNATGTVKLQMINKVYEMTKTGCGLRKLYFDSLMTLSGDEFELKVAEIDQTEIVKDLFEVAKKGLAGTTMGPKDMYHNAWDNDLDKP